jgi:para-aminobenzoate synthetase component I
MLQYKFIPYTDPVKIFNHFHKKPWSILLDSASLHPTLGRYSFIAIDPFKVISSKNAKTYINEQYVGNDPFSILQEQLRQYRLTSYEKLLPFQGGIAGFFGYDLCRQLEKKINVPIQDDMQYPDMVLGFYDLVIGFDHIKQKAWIFSSGLPEKNSSKRSQRAEQRLQWLTKELAKTNQSSLSISVGKITDEIFANFTRESYQYAVKKVIDYIYAGDVFEANISQRFQCKLAENISPFTLYQKVRQVNPAPFSAYFNANTTVIASASPERFLCLKNGQIETRPIKGTRPRGKNARQDILYAQELLRSKKDRAENIMIVDLMRNDLSRVCESNSIQVPQLCRLESYATVHHLVSAVTGKMRCDCDAIDLLRATFPGGSITGAPKVRAMEIIYEIEANCRGPYCGSVGYISFDGNMDTSILIRTYSIKNNIVCFQAGGAVTAGSDPNDEYEETLTKAAALRHALIQET